MRDAYFASGRTLGEPLHRQHHRCDHHARRWAFIPEDLQCEAAVPDTFDIL
ncbi:hypothetical protein AB0C13_26915 [Streptomyces sp. NPDC049099]|uniref:hypothetical protein n=1 Tax=Streptomyces sp. NPDC049099 TaxID=3155768 RepID=UPI00341CB0CA